MILQLLKMMSTFASNQCLEKLKHHLKKTTNNKTTPKKLKKNYSKMVIGKTVLVYLTF